MFFDTQSADNQKYYDGLLKVSGGLSKLFSDNEIPYLYYRMAENIFCKAFDAENLGRSDISLDARKNRLGIGLKTFICNTSQSVEKIAEFNKSKHLIDAVDSDREKICVISELRNERLQATGGICNIDIADMYYHCVCRDKGKFFIHETPIKEIQIADIGAIKQNGNTVNFSDGIYEYSFNFSKSTLYKRFLVNPIHEIDIKIIDDPYAFLENKANQKIIITRADLDVGQNKHIIGTVYLPLYSDRGDRNVPERSGLNQWNAAGRARNQDEIYIPVPRFVHNQYPNFFPSRDVPFKLKLPSGDYLSTKICQDNGKALMSNPNSALGKWLLRDVLKLQYGELLTYEKLEKVGVDSIEINKMVDGTYEINFKKIGTYDDFLGKANDDSE